MAHRIVSWLVTLTACTVVALAQDTTTPSTVPVPPANVTAIPLPVEQAARVVQPGDTVRLFCWNAGGLLVNSVLPVGTDGSVRPPGVPPVPAAGIKLADLQTSLVNSYSTIYTGATLLVTLEDSREPQVPALPEKAPTELTDALRPEQNIAIRCWSGEMEYLNVTTRVSRDMTIALPPLGPVSVEGETLISLRDKLQARYRAYYPRCSLSVLLADVTEEPTTPVVEEPEVPITEMFPPTVTAAEILKALPRFGCACLVLRVSRHSWPRRAPRRPTFRFRPTT
ncbi:MAG: polysaccharide biosynthesis/export family protein [Armatimonadetes bacterium]|nr:polysaccharide biosynthesis/export family protein [Armatimonadota bacterium]